MLMAPMAGVSDGVYRINLAGRSCRIQKYCCRIHYGGDKTWELVEALLQLEPDIAVQLFGSKPV